MADVKPSPAMLDMEAKPALAPDTSLEATTTSTDLVPTTDQTIITTNADGKKKSKRSSAASAGLRAPKSTPQPSNRKKSPKQETSTTSGTTNGLAATAKTNTSLKPRRLAAATLQKDSGYTKADKTPGSYFCLFFARGMCPKGVDCEYLHRLPTVTDIFPSNVDCFGRDKHADYRDDMGGVGTFQRQNRTLYIGRIHPTDDIEEVVARHMQEWGEIERTRVLTARGVAFVTYLNEANSQFAKEAMAHQAFDHGEILNVRWATVDPNPQAAKREARRIEEQAAEAIRKALPAAYVAELEGRDPEGKKRRKMEGSFGLQGYEAPDDVWYAKEKAEWEDRKRIENGGGGEHMMIEQGHEEAASAQQNAYAAQAAPQQDSGNSGILSGATLAALKGYTATASSSNKRPAPKAKAGLLVDYGSDSD
ncbi:Pre-mRNA-splicing factor cwc2 [Pyrenophora tritici-repentis]|nr:Pre-mRNA-splicing factor cwc2 [Pyrenophora tritici-repentis]